MRNLIFIIFLSLTGCAAEVVKSPSTLIPDSSDQPTIIEVINGTKVSSSSGYQNFIRSYSKWKLVGKIDQGNVYKSLDDVFIIEGAHIHEANLVINDSVLVGYYLPAIQSFSAAPKTITLETEQVRE